MLTEDQLREMRFYATANDYSDAERYERFALSLKLDERGREIGDVVASLAPARILECASATGLTAAGVKERLAAAGISATYHSLDIEDALLRFASARSRGDCFAQGSFEHVPFSGDFDVYIMMGAMGYRSSPDAFYAEVARVLKPGGHFVWPLIGIETRASDEEREAMARNGLTVVRDAGGFVVCRRQ